MNINFLQFLSSNSVAFGIVGAIITFSWGIIQYFLQRKKESAEKQFETYHRLIKELVSPENGNGTMWIDRQIAVIFELRHFPRYHEVTERLLDGLYKKWSTDPEFRWPRLLAEINFTQKYIQHQRAGIFKRKSQIK